METSPAGLGLGQWWFAWLRVQRAAACGTSRRHIGSAWRRVWQVLDTLPSHPIPLVDFARLDPTNPICITKNTLSTLLWNPVATMRALGHKPTPPSPLTPSSRTPLLKLVHPNPVPTLCPCAPPKHVPSTIPDPMPQQQP